MCHLADFHFMHHLQSKFTVIFLCFYCKTYTLCFTSKELDGRKMFHKNFNKERSDANFLKNCFAFWDFLTLFAFPIKSKLVNMFASEIYKKCILIKKWQALVFISDSQKEQA